MYIWGDHTNLAAGDLETVSSRVIDALADGLSAVLIVGKGRSNVLDLAG